MMNSIGPNRLNGSSDVGKSGGDFRLSSIGVQC